MRPLKNNNNEFELNSKSPRPVVLPYVRLRRRKPMGFLNSLQLPKLTALQRERLKNSFNRRDGQ